MKGINIKSMIGSLFAMHVQPYTNYAVAGICCISAVLTACALWSHSFLDSSWFFVTNEIGKVHNWCGTWGAHYSALLFFLSGTGAYMCVPFFLYGAYFFFFRLTWQDEWDRVMAGLLALCACALLLYSLYLPDITAASTSGGWLGYSLYTFLHIFLDAPLIILFSISTMFISFILITRLSFMRFFMFNATTMIYMYAAIVTLWNLATQCAALVFLLVKKTWHLCKKTMLGTDVEGEGNTVVEFEFGREAQKMVRQNLTDPFWQQLSADAPHNISTTQESVAPAKTLSEQHPVQMHSTQTAETAEKQPQITEASEKKEQKYDLPPMDIFMQQPAEKTTQKNRHDEYEELAGVLEQKLERFGVLGSVVSIKSGPVITLFEYQPDIDSKLSKIIALEDDLALALKALSIRIIAPIPGTAVVGFEVAKQHRQTVLLSDILASSAFKQFAGKLPLILGQNTVGVTTIVDLVSMPHLLIAGSTGSGKSVALNAMLFSLLCKCNPDQLRLILIDPKRLEFASYADIAHLLFPIVTDPQRAAPVLQWVVNTMDERYEKMASCGVRNIFDYHAKAKNNPEFEPMPFIVVMIDELSDLMMTAGKDVEQLIARIAQMARAAGIHLIVATQRPSVDVITGLIKVNFPSRISFKVTSKVDSRTILDCVGAEKLLGHGDMLFLDSASGLQRIHGAYVSNRQVEQLVGHIRAQRPTQYLNIHEELPIVDTEIAEIDQKLYQEVIDFLHTTDAISISLLQRKFRIGYNRSARIIDMLESRGLIMPSDGSKARKVIR